MSIETETQKLLDCGELHSKSIKEEDIIGVLSVQSLLQQPFETHVGLFELPESIKQILHIDEINAIITWYLKWKLTEPIATQNTCTIRKVFGYTDSIRIIVAINFYKYVRSELHRPKGRCF